MTLRAYCRLSFETLDPVDDNPSIGFVMDGELAAAWSDFGPVATHLEHFFNSVGTGGTNALAYYINNTISRSAGTATLTVYDITAFLDGTPHGSPVVVNSWTLGASSGGQSLPTGVAAAVSFRSDYGTDVEFEPGARPRARDRNRVYVGPLNFTAVQNDGSTARCELTPQFITDALAALFDLSNTVTDSAGNTWVLSVWSRKDAALKLPTLGWMDNRPDYQRRRSDPAPGTRVNRNLASV